jgi:hypothetical protein
MPAGMSGACIIEVNMEGGAIRRLQFRPLRFDWDEGEEVGSVWHELAIEAQWQQNKDGNRQEHPSREGSV